MGPMSDCFMMASASGAGLREPSPSAVSATPSRWSPPVSAASTASPPSAPTHAVPTAAPPHTTTPARVPSSSPTNGIAAMAPDAALRSMSLGGTGMRLNSPRAVMGLT